MSAGLQIKHLGLREYTETFEAMREFTANRGPEDDDQFWILEHPPIFTQGQAGKAEHLLDAGANPSDIPVLKSNRGGQITYHGPGQLVVYVLLDLHRLGIGARTLVGRLERTVVATLADFGIDGFARADAPGVYVAAAGMPAGTVAGCRKIASLGLRVSRGCSYHGLALNVDMDLSPFKRINPCGLAGMEMTQIADFAGSTAVDAVAERLTAHLQAEIYRGADAAVSLSGNDRASAALQGGTIPGNG